MQRNTTDFDAGLGAFTVQDLCHPNGLTDAIAAKLDSLSPGHFVHDRLAGGVRLILEIVRDAVCGGYRGLRLTALADFLGALDYFMRWADRIPDTWDGGYVDDLEEVVRALARHEAVVADHRAWLARRADMGAPPIRRSPPCARGTAHGVAWHASRESSPPESHCEQIRFYA